MPEGPECRRYAQLLAECVSGRKLESIEILGGRYKDKLPGGLHDFRKQLPLEVVGAGVHGKFIYWILKDELSIWCTLGMTGGWSTELQKNSRVVFGLNDGELYFNDMRNFGTLKFVRGKFKLIEKLKSLGPDILAEDVSDARFMGRLQKYPDWPVVNVLMSQGVIAGVGNYIKAESLWLAKISPHRLVRDLSNEDFSSLNKAIKHVMQESYDIGKDGGYSQKLKVYNQKTDPEGNEVIREMTADKRTTHWCPEVQK